METFARTDELAPAVAKLARLVERHTPREAENLPNIPGVRLNRASHSNIEWTPYAGLTPSLAWFRKAQRAP